MNSVFRNSLAIALQAGTKQYIKNNSKSDLVNYTTSRLSFPAILCFNVNNH